MKKFLLVATSIVALSLLPQSGSAQSASNFDDFVAGADISVGAVSIVVKDGSHHLIIPKDIFGRTLIWNAEVSRYPADAIAIAGNEIATHAVSLQRRDDIVFVRSLSSGAIKTAGEPHFTGGAGKMRPIDIAISNAQIGPILLALDIVAENDDGSLLLDISDVFTPDIADFSVKPQLETTGITPTAIDPQRSYITQATAFPENIFVTAQLTFMGQDAGGGARAISVEVAHTIALLPDKPMERRVSDPRVGYFSTELIDFETDSGATTEPVRLALRHRLEHADPNAQMPSDPLEPLVYYLSPEIPDRWRPYVRDAIEDWQPAFEAAGFTNAIIARDAPTQAEDPDWSPNDARYNVIRWVAQPYGNAMGPNIHDPRSGEIISAHILVWPEVLNLFSDYYYLLMSALDPDAASLPLPEHLQGHILRYAVSHEVGHTLGLRHNHRASTAWSIDQLRDPAFTAENGSTASIMAYGRFNYVARPQDGVTQLFPLIGNYDDHALEWGYSQGVNAEDLSAIAARSEVNSALAWGAGELPEEVLGKYDPTILTENIGSDRFEATRTGIAALKVALTRLPKAAYGTASPEATMSRVYDQAKERYAGFTDSVRQMVGGVTSTAADGNPWQFVSVADQKAALTYLASEAIADLEAFSDPELLMEFRPLGGVIGVNALAEDAITGLLDPVTIRRVYMQNVMEPERDFDVAAMLATITDAIIADPMAIEDMPVVRRAALARYVALLQTLPTFDGNPAMAELAALGFPQEIVELNMAGLTDTGISDAATTELKRLVEAFEPKGDGLATRLFKDVERLIGIDVDGNNGDAE